MTARRTLANAGLAAGATVLTLLVAEQALRLLGIDYRPVRIYARDPDQRGLHLFDEKQFVYDPELIWRPRPGASVFNSQGFRGPELPAVKPPGESWLFAVGDSNTLGWDTEKGANWPADLQRLLAAAGARFRVVNAGVYGYSSYQGLARLREALAYRPDWVLVSFGGNDGHPVGIGDREFLSRGAFARQIERALLPFRVGRLALGGLRAVARREGRTVRVPPDEYGEHLATMIAEARAAGADIALLTRPYVGPLGVQGTWKHVAPRYRELTVEVGAAHGAPVVDLYSEFKGRDDLFADESHFTNEGHREAARIVLETLRPLLVPSSP